MTPRERIKKAISHEETDFVPYEIQISPAMDVKLKERLGDHYRESIIEHYTWGGPAFGSTVAPYKLPDGNYGDPFGGVWQVGNIFHQLEAPLKEPSLSGLTWPDVSSDEDYASVYQVAENNQDRFTIGAFLLGLFERSWALRGMENILMDMATNPEFCDELYARIVDWNLQILEKLCDTPVDAVGFTDDVAGQHGLLMGPDFWNRYLKDHTATMVKYIKSRGKYAFIHNCGDNTAIMQDYVDMGLDIFNPLQPEAMDIFEIKRLYGANITFDGALSSQTTLRTGTPDEVRREVNDCLRELGRGGGLIIGPNKGIMDDVPVENAVALIEAITNQPSKR